MSLLVYVVVCRGKNEILFPQGRNDEETAQKFTLATNTCTVIDLKGSLLFNTV